MQELKDLGDERSRKEGFTTGGIRDTEDYMDCRAGGMQDRGGGEWVTFVMGPGRGEFDHQLER